MKKSKYIDHTILKATATTSDIKKLCAEAKEYDFMSVCVNPCHVKLVAEELKGSDVLVCTVIGFPLGANTSAVKAFETKEAIKDGASEIDMVINIGALKEGDLELVKDDMKAVVEAANGTLVKVIIETCYLTDEEIVAVSKLAKEVKADFVKTSTGFGSSGATVKAVKLMRDTVGENMGVKASGGIRTKDDMEAMIKAGASRIGCSAGKTIMEDYNK